MNAPTKPRLRPLPPGMPAALGPLHRRVADIVERLPSAPPSVLAGRVLDLALLPRLPADARHALQGRVVALHVTDFGLRVHLRLQGQRFVAAGDQAVPDVRVRATAQGFFRLAKGNEDPDRLFFERELVIDGDTELGLVLKNTLDAIGPLWRRPAAPARSAH